ncbi:uncharacterized protein K02A2.6-like [Macrosteles quadrilineatus]|uniref:uncharacterized protein K02A2.6-like n=1 Tax=Macrosteles quadrilineatus TaxID=74068 RepID=UPI0023E2AFB2|nr:uncharacterized protein K02A2.6-like [Macrosteles quadrilineatus]
MAQSTKRTDDLRIDAFDGHSEEWTYWLERFKIALRNRGIKNEDTKRDLLLGNLGPQPFKLVFDHARPDPVSNLHFTGVIDILKKYYTQKSAPLSQRVIFSRRFRQEGESVSHFEFALREIAGLCDFSDNLDERLRDQFVLGINNDRWQLELLRLHATTDTTFEQVTNTATLLENVDNQQSQFRNTRSVNRISNRNKKNAFETIPLKQETKGNTSKQNILHLNKRTDCIRCGYKKHTQGTSCPAVDATCNACGGLNHFARTCLKVGNAVIIKEVFSPSLGTIKNHKVSFHMASNAAPVVSKPRPVPFALREPVENEIQRLIDSGVLEPVDARNEPIIWASPIVIVVKPSGAIRICADFKNTINKHMLPDKYPMPTFEEITSKLTGGQEFSVIDLKDAYLQMEVEPSAQQYLIISTHKGFFKYKRLPFGIKIATGVFQCKMDQVLAGLHGVACLLDDVIVTAPTREEHIERVKEVLRRFQESGIRVQTSKCKWFQDSVNYLGHRIDRAGIHPTTEHLEAVKNMQSPKNVKELRSFLGSINYYSKFIPHLQSLCVPLHKLLKKGVKWHWNENHEQVAAKLRHLLTTTDTLAHYDESLPLILATDASDIGVGAALFQKYPDGTEKPLAFASRRLDHAECRYSVIEKEALGLVFGVTRFEQYLYGRHFEVRTDHKALVKVFGEHDSIPKVVSNRIARWALTLSAYDYSINYQQGKDNKTADLLSRFPLQNTIKSTEEDQGGSNKAHLFHLRSQDLPISTKCLQEATKTDPILSKVVNYLKRGCWPLENNEDTNLQPYYSKREELSFENGILLWFGRLVIPAKLRSRVMEILHEGHPGIVAMKGKARFQVWWPKLDKDLEEHTRHCNGCQENRSKDPEMPLFSWPVPGEVWSRIHIDFAGPFMGKMWLIVVDARSKWLEVFPMSSTSTKSTIKALEELFSRFGYPRVIVSDNGPQLTSYEFQTFCKSLNIKHARITPYHPKSNGLAERCVRTFKERMNASKGNAGTFQEKLNSFLFAYRTSLRRSTGKTPAFMMFGRELRSKLDMLFPDVEQKNDEELVQQRLQKPGSKEKVF